MSSGGELTAESRVSDNLHVLRLIHPLKFNYREPHGKRLPKSLLQSNEMHPNGYPSVYVEELATFQDIVAADLRFETFGLIRVRVAELRQRGVEVVFKPSEADCSYPTLRHAHAGLFVVKKDMRDELLEFLDPFVVRVPTEPE
jgi:hypothetical protein